MVNHGGGSRILGRGPRCANTPPSVLEYYCSATTDVELSFILLLHQSFMYNSQ